MINRDNNEHQGKKRKRWRMVDLDQFHSEHVYQTREIVLNKNNNDRTEKTPPRQARIHAVG
jgi:hypothetical protein